MSLWSIRYLRPSVPVPVYPDLSGFIGAPHTGLTVGLQEHLRLLDAMEIIGVGFSG